MALHLTLFLVLAISKLCWSLVDQSTYIAECRAQCLDKFLGTKQFSSDFDCKNDQNCHMCWDNCHRLLENFAVWGPMCTNEVICFPGCKQACAFHNEIRGRSVRAAFSEPIGHFPHPLIVQRVGDNGVLLTWKSPNPAVKFVYVVLKRSNTGSDEWQEITQTSDLLATVDGIPSGEKIDFEVRAITGSGVYATVESTFDTTQKNSDVIHTQHKVINSWDVAVSLQPSTSEDKIGVQVSWNPPKDGEFMVVWETVGNNLEIKGHAYTDSTTASFTLEKSRVYRIYVKLLGSDLKSEFIEINTGSHGIIQPDCTFKAIILTLSSVTLFLFVTFVIIFGYWFCTQYKRDSQRKRLRNLEILDVESGRSMNAVIGTLDKLSHNLQQRCNDYVTDYKPSGSTPPPYEVRDSNPCTPQVSLRGAGNNSSSDQTNVFNFEK